MFENLKYQLKLKDLFIFFNSLIGVLLIFLILTGLSMRRNQLELTKNNELRFNSHLLAQELKQNSDDLTNYCRNYVITGDPIWERKYWNVIDIRNGKINRKEGKRISLLDSIKKMNLAQVEYNKLKEAEEKSDELVYTEKVAFNAMKGLFDDGNGNFTLQQKPDTAMARRIMFDSKYTQSKEKIMKPLLDFSVLLDARTRKSVDEYNLKSKDLVSIIIGMVVIIIVISIISFFVINNKINNQLSNLKQLNIDKDNFISILAHDLKAPFNGILGILDLIVENIRKYDIDKIEKFSILANKSAHQVYNLMEDMLIWVTSQKDKFSFEPKKLNLKTTYTNVVDNLKLIAISKNIIINNSISDELIVDADENMLNTILRNLISNALKFTNTDGQIDIYAKDENANILITVSDNGVGIEPERITKLFDISQFQTTPGTGNEKGTGFGLFLCKEFVEKQGGKIWVESKLGKGSDFKFTIPKDLHL